MAEGVSFFRKMQWELTRSSYLTIMGTVPEDIQKQYLEIVDQIKAGSFVEE